MKRVRGRCWIVLSSLMLLAGCSSGPQAVTQATPAQQALLLDRMKSLEGEWVSKDEKGQWVTASVFKTTSSGSAVREVMMPGQPYEMTNVYHMDGSSLVMTHYCAQGNQPRMRAEAGTGNQIAFKFDSVTNFRDPVNETCMGEMTITFKDNDHIVTHWRSTVNGKYETDHEAVFELERRK